MPLDPLLNTQLFWLEKQRQCKHRRPKQGGKGRDNPPPQKKKPRSLIIADVV